MVHLEVDGTSKFGLSKIPKGFSPIFRWTSRLGLGGVDKKNGLGQQGQGSGELHADEDQTRKLKFYIPSLKLT